jgi:hypothetical protein
MMMMINKPYPKLPKKQMRKNSTFKARFGKASLR